MRLGEAVMLAKRVAGLSMALVSIAGCAPWRGVPHPGPRPAPEPVVVSVTVPLDCGGAADGITVTATLPRRVPATRAFPVTVSTSGSAGWVELSLSNATPATFTISTSRPSTTQVAATGPRGSRISLAVASAGYDLPGAGPGRLPPPTTVVCTPTGDAVVGEIGTVGSAAPGATGPTAIDVALATRCQVSGLPVGGASVRTTLSVPTEVATGETFSVPDLAATASVPGDVGPAIVVEGAAVSSGAFLTPEADVTVTAAPGEHVRLDVFAVGVFTGTFAVGCNPIGSGHLATIPVVSGTP
jgi:hypothetical protein